MRPDAAQRERLRFLCRVVGKEARHLLDTRQRLFVAGFDAQAVSRLEDQPALADCVEAFVGRFGRLQDTLGDKLLPALLAALGERVASVADNLDRAERLGLIDSADAWFTMRALRNQMVHDYVEDPLLLWAALDAGRTYTDSLNQAAERMVAEVHQRGWL